MIFDSTYFGTIDVDENCTLIFPAGLPGFEDRRRFLPLRSPRQGGLVYLQSLESAGLCFLALPVRGLRPDYEISVSAEDREILGLPPDLRPVIGRDVAVLAILSLAEGEPPTVNLCSPVLINARSRVAVQAIRPDERYKCREPLVSLDESVCS